MNSLLQQVGGSLGIALSGVIHTFITNYYLQKHSAMLVAEHYALQDSFLISAFVILLAIIPAIKLPEKKVGAHIGKGCCNLIVLKVCYNSQTITK